MKGSRSRYQLLGVRVVLCLASVVACADPPGPGDCTGDVDLQVTEGTVPTFSWAPPCELASLAVFDGGGQVYWAFHTGVGRNGLAPTIRYGQLPAEGIETSAPQGLRTGFGYTVRVFRLGHEDDQLVSRLAGEAHFRH
jgi:hypothetical protein